MAKLTEHADTIGFENSHRQLLDCFLLYKYRKYKNKEKETWKAHIPCRKFFLQCQVLEFRLTLVFIKLRSARLT